MTSFEDGLWTRLMDEHDAGSITLDRAPAPSPHRPLAIGGGIVALAGACAVGTVALTSATDASPAYALTSNPNGSITVTIHDLETALPELNARFTAMRIDMTVVPISTSCAATGARIVPLSGDSQTADGRSFTFTPGHRYAPPGYAGVVAAAQLPNGSVATDLGAVRLPAPNCLPADSYRLSPTGETSDGRPEYRVLPDSASTATSTLAPTRPTR